MKKYINPSYYIKKFQENNIKKHIINISWLLGGRVFSMLLSFFATMYIARGLGPTNFGQLSFALSVIGIIGFIAPLGLDSIVYRELIKYPSDKNKILGTSLYLKLISGTIVTITIIIVAFTTTTDNLSKTILMILAGTQFFNAFQLVAYDSLSKSDTKTQSKINIAISIIVNLLKITSIILGKGVISIAFILLFESILAAILFLYSYSKNNKICFAWNGTWAKSLLRDSVPMILITGFTVIYAKIDQVFINHYMSISKVGVYDAAVKLVDLWNFIPGAIVTALFPSIVRLQQNSKKLYKIKMFKLAIILTVIPAIISLTITILAPHIIKLIYGTTFIDSVSILKIYIWSSVGTSIGILVQNHLIATNERVLLILSSAIPMIVNIILNLLWIPTLGTSGAAYATLISYSMVPIVILFSNNKIKKDTFYANENI